jgi:hypothetical protein
MQAAHQGADVTRAARHLCLKVPILWEAVAQVADDELDAADHLI